MHEARLVLVQSLWRLGLFQGGANASSSVSPHRIAKRPSRNRSIQGSMDQEQQRLVRASFAKVAPIADTAAAMFYERLFATDPTLRSLYKDDMVVQGRLLMTMIGTGVEYVHQLDQILPAVRDLGRRHARYGVKAADYDTVAGALLVTLAGPRLQVHSGC